MEIKEPEIPVFQKLEKPKKGKNEDEQPLNEGKEESDTNRNKPISDDGSSLIS